MSSTNNAVAVTTLKQRIDGVAKYFKLEKVTIPVQGEMLTASGLTKRYQKALDARAAVVTQRAAYLAAVKSREEAEVYRLAADDSLKAWVLARFGVGSAEAGEFGFAPRRAPVVSAATRATAVLKNEATRKARGTMGKKEKLKIKGVLPTSTAPAAPAPNPVSAVPPVLASTPAAPGPIAIAAPGPVASPPPTASSASAVTVSPAVAPMGVVAHS